MITIKSAREVETMMAAGRILAETMQLVEAHTRPGTTTEELDRLATGCRRPDHDGGRRRAAHRARGGL